MIDWIPVSKGLPPLYEFVLITRGLDGIDERSVVSAFRDDNGLFYDCGFGNVLYFDVVAWARMPEPYKGEIE